MFRRGGKLSMLSSKDDRIKIINERISMTERHLLELCSCFASCTRKLAKCRNSYDELAKGFKSYADEEDINESLCTGMKSFTNAVTILADYMDTEVHRLEVKIISELSQFEHICKATKENLRLAVVARDKEVLKQKQMIEIKNKFSSNTSAADSELVRTKLEVSRANKEIDEIINNFEKRKLNDVKQLLTDFVLISMKKHTKALEALTATYYDITNIDEKVDLKDFQKLMKSTDESTKKGSLKKVLRTSQSLDELDREGLMSPAKKKLSRSTRNLSTEAQTDEDDAEEDSDGESQEEEGDSGSESEESVSQSNESDSDAPHGTPRKSTSSRIPKPRAPSSIGIPKGSPSSTAYGRMVTVSETKSDSTPSATPRQPIDCTGRRNFI